MPFLLRFIAVVTALLCVAVPELDAGFRVKKVDFKKPLGLKVNGAAPLLICADPPRKRVVVVHHQTASLSLIQYPGDTVKNIALGARIPHYLKSAALAVDPRSGNVYIVGDRSLHVVFPETMGSVHIPLEEQAEMVCVNSDTGHAYLVGRESRSLLRVDPRTRRIRRTLWREKRESMINRNATPPPPLRKVFWDGGLKRVFAVDADTRELTEFSARGKLLRNRKLDLAEGRRWHLAGFDPENHLLYVVIETAKRKVVQAACIRVDTGQVRCVALPGLTEAVGISLDPEGQRVFIPYDNHPTIHGVNFASLSPEVVEIPVPAFGNDASIVDRKRNRLYVAEWAHAEVVAVDLDRNRMVRRFREMEILPHMFQMAFLPGTEKLYIPVGATAVNGSFGASVHCLNIVTGEKKRLLTGWSPTGVVTDPGGEGVLVFDSENHMARVSPNGEWRSVTLPGRFFHQAVAGRDGRVLISFGAHQSFWPVPYIGGAWNGVVDLDPLTLAPEWRRLPRMAQGMVLDTTGRLIALQNNWGDEEQFLAVFPDSVREFDPGKRWQLKDRLTRETTQRLLEADGGKIFLARMGETNSDPGILQVLSGVDGGLIRRLEIGRTPVAMTLDANRVYVCCMDDACVVEIDRRDYSMRRRRVGRHPVDLHAVDGGLAVLCRGDRTLRILGRASRKEEIIPISPEGEPTGLLFVSGRIWVTLHARDCFRLLSLNEDSRGFETLVEDPYPYGRVTADTDNAAFFMRGQYGDGLYILNHMATDHSGRLYLTDFLSGRMWIMTPED